MPQDVKPRQLTKQLEGVTITSTIDGGSGFLTAVNATNAWDTIVQGVGSGAVVKRTYIDLAGWTKEELTTFVQGVDIQKMRTPLTSTTSGNPDFPIIWEYDILSTRKIELSEIAFNPLVPGWIGAPSTLDMQSVVYGQSRTYSFNTTIPLSYVTTDTGTFGSGDAVATDKLHWTRIVVFMIGGASGTLTMYPANLVVQAVTAKEKDLVWMERLRRSYILQDPADQAGL